MSVIVVTPSGSAHLLAALACLRSQTVASELEAVLAVPSASAMSGVADLLPGMKVRVVEGASSSWGEAKAAAVREASADIVAFMEDHSFPDPRWAEELGHALMEGDYAAVGPVVGNANPRTAASWGCLLVYYGAWIAALPRDRVRHLPANQSCYRKHVLLGYGPRLAEMLEAESVLHADLLRRGLRIAQLETARVRHLNYSRVWPAVSEYFLASRVFAAERCASWSLAWRIVYGFGSPLIPLIRLPRLAAQARRGNLPPGLFLRASFPALAALCAGAAGELLGYLLGAGNSRQELMRFESQRDRMFTPADLEAVQCR